MLIKIMVAECDICGRTDKAVRTSGQYNEDEYRLPDGWMSSKVNGSFCFCPKCAAALEKEDAGR